jgi:hypothetical protein
MSDDAMLDGLPIEDVLAGMEIPALPPDTSPVGMIAFVKLREADGGTGWSLRVTRDIDDEEALGLLVGYVHKATRDAADSWDDTDPTR